MSLYREVERQRRKRREQQCKRGSKKSSLSAALSASLTALFTSGKDSANTTDGYSADYGDYDYYYGPAASSTKRVEYVTVRGYRPGCENYECEFRFENNNCFDVNADNVSMNSVTCDHTKGLAQMAVALGMFIITFIICAYISRNNRNLNMYTSNSNTHDCLKMV